MKNITLNCKVDFITNSIIVTKAFLRKSADPTTEEFRMMRDLTTQMPNLAVRVKQSVRSFPLMIRCSASSNTMIRKPSKPSTL